MERKQIRKITLTALFAALISAGAFIRIPMVPVPITLTTLFTMLGSACLPPSLALSSVIVYLFIGTAGLPVFTSGGGLASLLGPTGGYLIGMIPAAFAGSMLMKAFEAKPRAGALLSSLLLAYCGHLAGIDTVFGGGLGGRCGTTLVLWAEVQFGAAVTGLLIVLLIAVYFFFLSRRFCRWLSSLGRSREHRKKGKAEDRVRAGDDGTTEAGVPAEAGTEEEGKQSRYPGTGRLPRKPWNGLP